MHLSTKSELGFFVCGGRVRWTFSHVPANHCVTRGLHCRLRFVDTVQGNSCGYGTGWPWSSNGSTVATWAANTFTSVGGGETTSFVWSTSTRMPSTSNVYSVAIGAGSISWTTTPGRRSSRPPYSPDNGWKPYWRWTTSCKSTMSKRRRKTSCTKRSINSSRAITTGYVLPTSTIIEFFGREFNVEFPKNKPKACPRYLHLTM